MYNNLIISKERERINILVEYLEKIQSKINIKEGDKFKLLENNSSNIEKNRELILNDLNDTINLIRSNSLIDLVQNESENNKKYSRKRIVEKLYENYEYDESGIKDPFMYYGKKIRNSIKHKLKFSDNHYDDDRYMCFAVLIWIRANFKLKKDLLKKEKRVLLTIGFKNKFNEKEEKDLNKKAKVCHNKILELRRDISYYIQSKCNQELLIKYKTDKITYLYKLMVDNKIIIPSNTLISLFTIALYDNIANKYEQKEYDDYSYDLINLYSSASCILFKSYSKKV